MLYIIIEISTFFFFEKFVEKLESLEANNYYICDRWIVSP